MLLLRRRRRSVLVETELYTILVTSERVSWMAYSFASSHTLADTLYKRNYQKTGTTRPDDTSFLERRR